MNCPPSSDAGGLVQNPAPNRKQPHCTTLHQTNQCGVGSKEYSLLAVRITVVFCEDVRTAVHRFRTDLPIGCWDSRKMTFLKSFRLTQNTFSPLCTVTTCTFGCCIIQKHFEHPISAHLMVCLPRVDGCAHAPGGGTPKGTISCSWRTFVVSTRCNLGKQCVRMHHDIPQQGT